MYPKTYLFHDCDLDGLDHLISSPVTLTFGIGQVYSNQKAHKDISYMLDLYGACEKHIRPKYITCIYGSKSQEVFALLLKFGISDYCYIKSDEHLTLAKALINIHKKLEGTMQNISGLESNLRACYKSLETLNLTGQSPLDSANIDDLSHILSFRKVSRQKLNDLIRSEFITDIC